MIRRPPRSTQSRSSAASDVYKRQIIIAVKAAFDPFILPLLSTHMGLTFLSYGLEKAFGEGDPEDDGGFRL